VQSIFAAKVGQVVQGRGALDLLVGRGGLFVGEAVGGAGGLAPDGANQLEGGGLRRGIVSLVCQARV